jgi:hypothetical protein
MKEKILNYLHTTTRRKRAAFFISYEEWYPLLELKFKQMKLPDEWSVQRKLWHYWNDTSEVPRCPITGEFKKWRAGKATDKLSLPHMTEGYSMFSNQQTANINTMSSFEKKHGVSNPMYLPGIFEKRKLFFLEKYGVENPSSNIKVKEKRINTMMERHGIPHNFINCQESFFNKFGVKNPAHVAEIADKICYNRFKKRKNYILETGEVITLQGYEPFGLEYLKTIYKENEIFYKKKHMPKIWYNHNNKEHRYYCDFYIPLSKMIVEIKSEYTLAKDYTIIKKKLYSSHINGYKVLLLVFDSFGNLTLELDNIDHL